MYSLAWRALFSASGFLYMKSGRQSCYAALRLALLLTLCQRVVLAGPPFVTDDPEPVDYQHWEFYVASQDSKLEGDWSGTAPHIEVNYGAVADLQLHLIAPMAYDSPPEGAGHYGVGDVELG